MTSTTLFARAAPRRPPRSSADLERRYGAANYHPLPVTLQRGEGVWLFDDARPPPPRHDVGVLGGELRPRPSGARRAC